MEKSQPGKFYSGTSGLVLPAPNKQHFPPEFQNKPRLSYYASLLNSIEVNSSFYKVPQATTVRKWAASVPDDFKFTFKLWRDITHNKGLIYDPDTITHFMNVIDTVGNKKGSLLIQFPPGLKVDTFSKVEGLLKQIRIADSSNTWNVAIEFRHSSWYQEKTYRLLDNYAMGMVLHDMPVSATPMMETEANFIYLRFHGPNGGYRGSYSDDHLMEYGSYIRDWLTDGKTVYTYFNNTMGEAVQNLNALNRFTDTF